MLANRVIVARSLGVLTIFLMSNARPARRRGPRGRRRHRRGDGDHRCSFSRIARLALSCDITRDMSQLPESSTSRRPGNSAIAAARRGARATPPVALVLLSIVSVQLGAALAKGLFGALGPLGTVFLRVGFAALVMLALWRPRLSQLSPLTPSPAVSRPVRGRWPSRRDGWTVLLFGLTIAAMNSLFYAAIARVPLGIAVTAEFVGPLAVALLQSRNGRDVAWAVLVSRFLSSWRLSDGCRRECLGCC